VYKSVSESLHANSEVLRREVYHRCAVAQGLDTGLSRQSFWFMWIFWWTEYFVYPNARQP